MKGLSHGLNLLRRPLFVILQRRNFHQRPFRVGAIHSLAVVAQGLLREAYGMANGLGAFRPRIAIRMQRDALDAQGHTALVKFGLAVPGAHGSQIRKQRSFVRQ